MLIGDHLKLPELEAGGLFRALVERTDAIELTEVRRHRHALDRENVELVRQGRGAQAFETYLEAERVTIAPDADSRRAAMVADWWESFAAGEQAIMIAKRNRRRRRAERPGARADAGLRSARLP
ncbi:MAG: AAA family ATPase [Solirubrobacterales bacterium]